MAAGIASTVTVVAPFMVLVVIAAAVIVRARRQPAGGWHRTQGTVLSSTVQMGAAGPSPGEAPLVLYAYQVNGTVFRGHRVRTKRGPCNASSVIARYPAGASVVVYYDPTDPANSALEL
jgi:Protein of unknown function (DUF3592)